MISCLESKEGDCVGHVCLYAWENVNVHHSSKVWLSVSYVWLWYFNVALLCVRIWKWLVRFPLANSCCPPAEIGVGAQATWSLFVAVVNFSLSATTTLSRIGLSLYAVHMSLFQANVFVKYISMESAEGN